MTGYTRQSTSLIIPGEDITAGPLANEFNAIEAAFDGVFGHTHDGSVGNSPKIPLTTSVTGILPLLNGGTGASTAADARTNLGLGTISTQDANAVLISGGIISGVAISSLAIDLAIADGGTGASTAVDARTNLGLGTIATQDATSVIISGGIIQTTTLSSVTISSLVTPLAVSYGGTGASTASDARTNLGLGTIATQNANSVAITGGTISNLNSLNFGSEFVVLTTDLSRHIALYSNTHGINAYSGGINYVVPTAMGHQYIVGGSSVGGFTSSGLTLFTPLSISNGGTGSATAAEARAALGVQALDATLTALSGLTITNGSFIRGTGADAFAVQSIIGTVSQSAGVVTGALFETATSGNRKVTKYADGTFILTMPEVVLGFATTNRLDASVNFSALVTAVDNNYTVHSTPSAGSAASTTIASDLSIGVRDLGVMVTGVKTTTSFVVSMWSLSSVTTNLVAGDTIPVDLTVIGRWF